VGKGEGGGEKKQVKEGKGERWPHELAAVPEKGGKGSPQDSKRGRPMILLLGNLEKGGEKKEDSRGRPENGGKESSSIAGGSIPSYF